MLTALKWLACVWCALSVAASAASAQPDGALAGAVRDVAGVALAGVSVSVSSDALGAPRSTVTNSEGRFRFDALPPGRYVIVVEIAGFGSVREEIDIGTRAISRDVVLSGSSHLERVTVTATRVGPIDVQSTPIAVTSLAGAALDGSAAQTIHALGGLVPTLMIPESAGERPQVTIRWISTNSVNAGSDPSTTVHVDGVYLARPAMMSAELLDVERIEVLRGPQGTLYGRNSIGGTIHIQTRQPTNDFQSRARFTAGNFGRLRAETTVSGPIVTNKLLVRLSAARGVRDGFVKNLTRPDEPLGGDDMTVGRAQLRLLVTPQADLLLSADVARYQPIPLVTPKVIKVKPAFEDRIDNPPGLHDVRASSPSASDNRQHGGSARSQSVWDPR